MKFDKRRCAFEMWKNVWYALPTIVIRTNQYIYRDVNCSIEFHWLCFHARLMWMGGEKHE